jgi:hypothetical protein
MRPGGWGWTAAALLAGGLGVACTPTPSAPPPLMQVDLEGQTIGYTGAMNVRVPRLHAQQRPGGGWHVVAEVVADYAGTHSFDGLHTQFHSTLVPRDRIMLVADGKEWPSVADGALQNPIEDNLIVSSEPPRRAAGRIAWDVDTPLLGDDLFVRLHAYEGDADVRIRGAWRTPDRQPAVAVQLVDPIGTPTVAPVALTSGTQRVQRVNTWSPWLVPAKPGTWTVVGDGYAPTTVVIPDPPPTELTVSLTRTDVATQFDTELTAAWGPVQPDRRDDVLQVADDLDDPESAADWVIANLSALPTMSFQHGEGFVVRRGAGGPFERALLARDLVRRQGREARVACGDLELDDTLSLYATPPAPQPDPLLASTLARVKPTADALKPAVAAGLATWPERPLGKRARYDVLPEWCWVEHRPYTQSDDTPWSTLDLRPKALQDTPLPAPWRTMVALGDEVWWVAISLGATYRHMDGDKERFETVELVQSRTNGALLSDSAVLIDLFKGAEPGMMRSQVSVVTDDEVRGEEGKDFGRSDLVSVYLNIQWSDPDRMGDANRTFDLWIPRPDESLTALRILLSADSGMLDVARAQRRVSRAISGAHPAPDALAMWSRHDVYSLIRSHLTGGQVSAEPQVLATTLRAFEDGRASWNFQALPSAVPARPGEGSDADAVAAFVSADAAARAELLGASPPAAPTEWVRDEGEGNHIYKADAFDQSSVIRGLGQTAYAVEPGGTWWMVDRVGGGASWLDRAGAPAVPAPAAPMNVPVGDRVWPYLFWDRTIRCTEGARWAAMLGHPAPASCKL